MKAMGRAARVLGSTSMPMEPEFNRGRKAGWGGGGDDGAGRRPEKIDFDHKGEFGITLAIFDW